MHALHELGHAAVGERGPVLLVGDQARVEVAGEQGQGPPGGAQRQAAGRGDALLGVGVGIQAGVGGRRGKAPGLLPLHGLPATRGGGGAAAHEHAQEGTAGCVPEEDGGAGGRPHGRAVGRGRQEADRAAVRFVIAAAPHLTRAQRA